MHSQTSSAKLKTFMTQNAVWLLPILAMVSGFARTVAAAASTLYLSSRRYDATAAAVGKLCDQCAARPVFSQGFS